MADRTAGSGSVTAALLPGEIERIVWVACGCTSCISALRGNGTFARPPYGCCAEQHLLAITTALAQARQEQEDLLETAWGVIANASGGRWAEQSPEWQGAAERWRDRWHATLPKLAESAPDVTPPLEGA